MNMPRVGKNIDMEEGESLEGSPLLMNMDKTEAGASMAASRKSRFHSTINPEKFDMTRFTSRVEEEESESSFRIILYVVAVIVVGVGLALFVKFFITKNDKTVNTPETTDTDNTVQTEKVVDIAIAPKADSNAIENSAAYTESEQVTLGLPTANAAGSTVSKLAYTRYNTFAQVVLGLTGLTNSEIPSIVATFDKSTDLLTLKFPTATAFAPEIKSEININDIVTSINFDTAANALKVKFREDSSYKVFIDNGRIVVSIRTASQIAKDSAITAPPTITPPTTTPPTTTPTPPVTPPASNGAINYTNEYSRNKQMITSKVTTDAISYNEIFYTDSVDSFELAFGMRNNVGENFIPNTTAELVTENGVSYIDITIDNLSAIQFTSDNILDQSDSPISLATANFVRAELKSFDASTGIAKIRIQLKNAADFKISSETTISGQTQVLGIHMKD